MAEYKSNYTGQEIDTAIGKANTALQTETDPIFSASASANITSQDITNWNAKSDFSGSYNDLTDKPTIPDVSNFITKDVNDLTYYELKTAVGNSIEMSIDSSTYVLTVSLKNSAGTVLNTQTVDLPLETMVVSGSYDSTNKKIILTLKNGQTIEFSVADLVSGLQSEITSSNKLSSDLVDDTNSMNKFVSATDKTNWNAKYTKPIAGIPDTDLSSAVQTSLGKADTALQSETYTGTITSVKMNGSTVASSGEADLGTVLTQHQDISGKQDIIQYSTMPTASSETVGKIVQYIGTTTNDYTNGYFYIGTDTSGVYSWKNVDVQNAGSSIELNVLGTNWGSGTPLDLTDKVGVFVGQTLKYDGLYGLRIKIGDDVISSMYIQPIMIVIFRKSSEVTTANTAIGYVFGIGKGSLGTYNLNGRLLICPIKTNYNGQHFAIENPTSGDTFKTILSGYENSLDGRLVVSDATSIPFINTNLSISDDRHVTNKYYVDNQDKIVSNNLAPAYDSTATYNEGDYVTYNKLLYKCNTTISTAEAWTSAHWTQTTVMQEIANLNS